MADTPAEIADLAATCVSYVHKSLGLMLDYTQDTLPILDHYVRSAEGASSEVVELMAAPTGAYFGEVLRQHIAGVRWHVSAANHQATRLEWEPCFLWFNPVGVAREVISQAPAADWFAHFQMLDAERPLVESALSHAGQVNEADYFTFSVRYEVVELVSSILVARAVVPGSAPKLFGADVYRVAVGERTPSGTLS